MPQDGFKEQKEEQPSTLLWAEIEMAEGNTRTAASRLITARNKQSEGDDDSGVTHVR